jgi:hypothetical protein
MFTHKDDDSSADEEADLIRKHDEFVQEKERREMRVSYKDSAEMAESVSKQLLQGSAQIDESYGADPLKQSGKLSASGSASSPERSSASPEKQVNFFHQAPSSQQP